MGRKTDNIMNYEGMKMTLSLKNTAFHIQESNSFVLHLMLDCMCLGEISDMFAL